MSEPIQPVPFLDNPLLPDVFVDDAFGLHLLDGAVRITLTATRVSHSSPTSPAVRVGVGRLILTTQAAQRLSISLFDFLKTHGLDPAAAITAGETAQ